MTKEQKEPWRKLADDAIKEKEFAAKKRTATVRSKSAKARPTAAAGTRKPTKTARKVKVCFLFLNTHEYNVVR